MSGGGHRRCWKHGAWRGWRRVVEPGDVGGRRRRGLWWRWRGRCWGWRGGVHGCHGALRGCWVAGRLGGAAWVCRGCWGAGIGWVAGDRRMRRGRRWRRRWRRIQPALWMHACETWMYPAYMHIHHCFTRQTSVAKHDGSSHTKRVPNPPRGRAGTGI